LSQNGNSIPVIDISDRRRGDTFPFRFRILLDGVAYSGTEKTLTMSVTPEPRPTTANYIFQLTGTDAGDGVISFPISKEQADITGRFYYDVEEREGDIIKTLVEGVIVFKQDRTKEPVSG